MSLQFLRGPLRTQLQTLRNQTSVEAWIRDQEMMGEKVAQFRDYADGDHQANLTPEMRRMLRIPNTGSLNEFNDNYMDVIIATMTDRLQVTAIEGDNDKATGWAADVLDRNRFDGMQHDTHDATILDGNSYVLVDWDSDGRRVRFTPEPAFDNRGGMLVLYEGRNQMTPLLACKIWFITTDSDKIADTARVNVYYPDRIEKFIGATGTESLNRYEVEGEPWPAPWVDATGQPLGVPVVHFRNRGRLYNNYGVSEIENAIPLQNALNRTLYSMVMASELTAFQIRIAKGFTGPRDITPGMWVDITREGGSPLQRDDVVDAYTLDSGTPEPFIEQARWLVSEIGKITRTPAPEFEQGANVSGESLKQREIGLLGKVRRFQVTAGNSWEDCMMLAHRVQSAFSNEQPPAVERFYARWRDPEIRNDSEAIDNILKVADRVDERTVLEMLGEIYDWDAAKIDGILTNRNTQVVQRAEALGASLPNFTTNGFNQREVA